MRALIEAKGLYSADAFRVFDADRTGTLSSSELAAALAWLGLHLPPAGIHELVRSIDTDHDGMVRLRVRVRVWVRVRNGAPRPRRHRLPSPHGAPAPRAPRAQQPERPHAEAHTP